MNDDVKKAVADLRASIRGWKAQQDQLKYHAQHTDDERLQQSYINQIAGLEASIADAERQIRDAR